jgi:uncharacterized paraquat-inducible protein A
VPWCDTCDRLVDDDLVTDTGACPSCGTSIVEPERGPLPWRFRLMIAATVVYLGWRTYQGVEWLLHR